MDALTARPNLLKQANLSLIRGVVKARGTATRAEIAGETHISSTTVRSLLAELMENGEIESMGYDSSSGGRKAERYRIRPDRYHSAVFCMTDTEVHFLLVDICENIVEKRPLTVVNGDFMAAITACLDEVLSRRELKAIGLGVPGVVEGGGYWKKALTDEDLHRIDIGEALTQKYGLPVVLENDLKATAIGFGHCYEKSYPCEDPSLTNMAYLHFDDCISAGFLAEGKVLRGFSNFAGELSLIPMEDGRLLDEHLLNAVGDKDYVNLVTRILCWLCAILNPQYIALGGYGLRRECVGPIGDALSSLLPRNMAAEILCAPDVWHDYYEGMACLTAAKMFDEVQFIKE